MKTFAADPEYIAKFIIDGKARGHRFYCVTARQNTEENEDIINEMFDMHGCQMPIIMTSGESKVEFVERLGIKIDVWLDDAPYALVHGH
jgi:hypothetical protein